MIYCWSTSILHLAIQAKGPLNKRKRGGVSGGQTFTIESLDGIGCWMCYLILRTPFVHSFADMTLMYLDTCAARACRQKLLLKSLGAWFMTAVWRESSRDHWDFTRHSPLAIYYTPITFHSFWENRVRVFQTHVAIKCQAHAQLFVAEKAARSAGGTVTGVHAFSIFSAERQPMTLICPSPPLPLSLHHHLEKISHCFFMTFSSFRFCLMKLLVQVTGGSNGGTVDSSFRCGCVGVTTFEEGNVWPFPRPRPRVFLDWSKGFVCECNCRRYQEDPLDKRTSARQRRRQKNNGSLARHFVWNFASLANWLARDMPGKNVIDLMQSRNINLNQDMSGCKCGMCSTWRGTINCIWLRVKTDFEDGYTSLGFVAEVDMSECLLAAAVLSLESR